MIKILARFMLCLFATGYICGLAAHHGYLPALVVLCSGIGVAIWSLHWR